MADERDGSPSRATAEERRTLLRQLLEARTGSVPEYQPLGLSNGQQALWYLYRLAPKSTAYNISLLLALPVQAGPEDVRRALQNVVDRHPMLRSRFRAGGEGPVREVDPAFVLPFTHVEWDGALDRLVEGATQHVEEPFDLEQGPVIRACYWTGHGPSNPLLVVAHHIVTDAVSMSIVEDELQRMVAAQVAGRPMPSLPDEEPYERYVQWHRRLLEGPEGKRLRAFWLEQFRDGIPTLNFGPRPATNALQGKKRIQSFQLDPPVAAGALVYCREEGVTPFVLLLTAFAVVIGRMAGADLVPVGTAALGRTLPVFRHTVGYFANPLLLKVDLRHDPDFPSLLAQVRQTLIQSLEHQEYPLAMLAHQLAREGTGRAASPFQVMYIHQDLQSLTTIAGVPLAERVQVAADPEVARALIPAVGSRGGESGLLLETMSFSGSIYGSLAFDAETFGASSVERVVSEFEALLRDVVQAPKRSAWDRARTGPPVRAVEADALSPQHTIQELFAEQVALHPEAIAVRDTAGTVSYRELDIDSDHLARRLCAAGAKPGHRVIVAAERTRRAVTALLGVLKARATYVPVDLAEPLARVQAIVELAEVRVAVVDRPGSTLLSSVPTLQMLRLEDDARSPVEGGGERAGEPATTADAESPAYVMFTSGSTGVPKGVIVPHRAVVRLVRDTDYIRIRPEHRIAQVANLAFDASTFEIWGALLNGATLVMVERERTLSPRQFATYLSEFQIDVVFLTTALFNVLAAEVAGCFASLEYVLFGGERVDPASVRDVLCAGRPTHLLHVYGPTENTTFSTWYPVQSVAEEDPTVPIGRPISQTSFMVLDAHRSPVPRGATGELYLGGAGLALGYLRDPERTAESFVAHPFQPDTRLYRTGDLVYENDDGALVFVGRMDRQVKIRGFRVELEDIESALATHPQVRSCIVDLWQPKQGDRSLVAYYVPTRSQSLPPDLVQQYLRERLPPYMMPAHLVPMDALPLNANGKIDRSALPTPSKSHEVRSGNEENPVNAIELRLAQTWAELLNRDHVGRTDDFFALGGHSLLAAQLVARIEVEFDESLPISTVLTAPTIADQARFLQDKGVRQDPVVPLRKGPGHPLYCVPGAGGSALMFYQLARRLTGEHSLYSIEPRETQDDRVGDATIESIATSCIAALEKHQPEGPYLLAGYSAGGLVAYEMAQQLRASGKEVAMLALFDTFNPFTVPRLRRRVAQQWARISALNYRAQIDYVARRIYDLARSSTSRVHRSLRYRLNRNARGAAQQALVQSQLMVAQSKAAYQYQPRPYAGKLTLFRSAQRSDYGPFATDDFRWGKLVQEIDVRHVEGLHTSILQEPDVASLAAALAACMNELQTDSMAYEGEKGGSPSRT